MYIETVQSRFWLPLATIVFGLANLGACGSSKEEATVPDAATEIPPDDDGDGITDFSDNCPTFANPGQEDQDGDDAGDVCDVTNDSESIAVANPDLEDSDRDSNKRGCTSDAVLSGITLGFDNASTYVDTVYIRCTERYAPFAITEVAGEPGNVRGPDVNCDDGEVVVGITYKEAVGSTKPDDRIDAATLLCAPAAGPDTNARIVPDEAYDENQGPAITLQCPEGATAQGILDIDSDTGSNNSDAIDGIGLECRAGRW